MKKKLVFGGLLLLLVCMLGICEGQSKEQEDNSNKQGVKSEMLKNEGEKVALGQVSAKEKGKTISKKTVQSNKVDKIKLEKTEEEKKVEKEVLKWVRRIERKCIGDDTNPIGWLMGGELHKLREIGKPAIPTLIEVFCDKDRKWMLRYFIGNEVLVSFAEKMKDTRFIEVLKVLEDRTDQETTRMIAAIILGVSEDRRGTKPLIELYKKEKNVSVRRHIVMGLWALKDERAIELFVEILNTPNEELKARSSAVFGLAYIARHNILERERVVDILLYELKLMQEGKKSSDVRTSLVEAIGQTNSPSAVEPLIDELRKGNMWAAEALGNIGKDVKDDRIIEALIEGLKHEDELMKMVIAKTLGEMGDKRAVEPLEKTLEEVKKGNKDIIANALKKLTGKEYKY